MIDLVRDGQTAAVSPRGAALCSWQGRISYLEPGDPSHAYDGAVLMPWPNRVRDGRYAFGGRGFELPITEPPRNAALHGFAAEVEWEIADQTASAVTLRREVRGPGYPTKLDAAVTYALTPDGLDVELSAVNSGDEAAPFGCGSHPYLAIAPDDARLELPARAFVPSDERHLPSGPPQPVGELPAQLDTCFTELERDADGRARVRAGDVVVWLDAAFGFVHVYTGDDDPVPARRRTRMAVEPVTCAPDSFNTGLGLLTLHPGERFRGRWGLETEPGDPP